MHPNHLRKVMQWRDGNPGYAPTDCLDFQAAVKAFPPASLAVLRQDALRADPPSLSPRPLVLAGHFFALAAS
jgi:hypothetical protein